MRMTKLRKFLNNLDQSRYQSIFQSVTFFEVFQKTIQVFWFGAEKPEFNSAR